MKKLFPMLAIALTFAACDKTPDGLPVDNKTLTLSADKTTIIVNGTDAVAFTVKQGTKDVTDLMSICTPAGMCLLNNVFASDNPGDYEFYAYFTDKTANPDLESNHLTITVEPILVSVDFDATRKLHRNVTYFVFTRSTCIFCPIAKKFIERLKTDYGNIITEVDFYESESVRQLIYYRNDYAKQIFWKGNRASFPSYFIDMKNEYIGAENDYAIYKNELEGYLDAPAKTGIKVHAAIEGDRINATVTVGAQEADTYQIGVYLVEDNIVAPQENGRADGRDIDDYNHTNVLRECIPQTNVYGEAFATMDAGDVVTKEYSFALHPDYEKAFRYPDTPDHYPEYNPENLSIIVCMFYQEGENWVIANSVKAPVGKLTPFKYAE